MKYIPLLIVASLFLGKNAVCQDIPNNLIGEALIQELRAQFSPSQTLSYGRARTLMFSDIDNVNGSVELVYTGELFRTSGVPNANIVNTEHTWAQSKFSGSGSNAMKTDLHHLYPTYNPTNGARGNKPFADIDDYQTKKWWNSFRPIRSMPRYNIDEYSESTNQLFEPREKHKGNVARSMFYFYTIYGNRSIDKRWFRPQIPTLLRWHQQDPVDTTERLRSAEIAAAQGNENPYVTHPELVARAFQSRDGSNREPGVPDGRDLIDSSQFLTVDQALSLPDGAKVKIKAKILGGFNSPFGLKLADDGSQRFLAVQVPRQFRENFSPGFNDSVVGETVVVEGTRRKYAAIAGLKSVSSIRLTTDEESVDERSPSSQMQPLSLESVASNSVELALSAPEAITSSRLDPNREGVFVRVVDVGAGLCCIVKVTDSNGDSRFMVFDTGNYENEGRYRGRTVSGFIAFSEAQELIPSNATIDWLVHSHEDADHIAATPLFCSEYTIKNFLRTGWKRNPSRSTQERALEAIRNEVSNEGARDWVQSDSRKRMDIGGQFSLGAATVTLLSGFGKPPEDWYSDFPDNRFPKSKRRNSISIVLRLDYKGRSILFTGDALGKLDSSSQRSIATERFLLANSGGNRILKADVLIPPHHGAENGASPDFIDAVSPRFVVFPAGDKHGHPKWTTVKRFIDSGSTKFMFRTDLGDHRSRNSWNWHSSTQGDGPGDDHVDIALTPNGKAYTYYKDRDKRAYSVAN